MKVAAGFIVESKRKKEKDKNPTFFYNPILHYFLKIPWKKIQLDTPNLNGSLVKKSYQKPINKTNEEL